MKKVGGRKCGASADIGGVGGRTVEGRDGAARRRVAGQRKCQGEDDGGVTHEQTRASVEKRIFCRRLCSSRAVLIKAR